MRKYLWYTDLHLDTATPWTVFKFIRYIRDQNPKGLFLTGDISNGLLTCFHLKTLAKLLDCPIYFVLGNHDYFFHSIKEQHEKVRGLCKEYKNLIWLSESDVINLQNGVALIGDGSWYDANLGNPKYLKATFDWMLIKDFRDLPTMEHRIDKFRQIANQSTQFLKNQLEKTLKQGYKTIYILTHIPPWKEATKDEGSLLEQLYLPYNVNVGLGQMIEKLMLDRKKRDVTVCSGHSHEHQFIRVSRNIHCQVGYPGISKQNSQIIYV